MTAYTYSRFFWANMHDIIVMVPDQIAADQHVHDVARTVFPAKLPGGGTAFVRLDGDAYGLHTLGRGDMVVVPAIYTLAIAGDMLLATVIDGGDIEAAVATECAMAGIEPLEYRTIHNCLLTDDYPEDSDAIVWRSGNCGWLIDESGCGWRFAVRA